ncbi:MAG: hypothetical protein ACLS43_04415 [Evtepia gabavorous]
MGGRHDGRPTSPWTPSAPLWTTTGSSWTPTCEAMNVAPLADKFRAFGWQVLSVDATAWMPWPRPSGRPPPPGASHRAAGPHREGQGGLLHGGPARLARQGPHDQELAAALAELAEGGTL